MNKSIKSFRQDELKAIYRFIDTAYKKEINNILNEIIVCHGLTVFDSETNKEKTVRCICLDDDKVILKTEKEVIYE